MDEKIRAIIDEHINDVINLLQRCDEYMQKMKDTESVIEKIGYEALYDECKKELDKRHKKLGAAITRAVLTTRTEVPHAE